MRLGSVLIAFAAASTIRPAGAQTNAAEPSVMIVALPQGVQSVDFPSRCADAPDEAKPDEFRCIGG